MLKRKIFELLNSDVFDDGRGGGASGSPGGNWKQRNNSFGVNRGGARAESLDALKRGMQSLAAEKRGSNEWLREVKVASALARHIVNNSKIPGWYCPATIQETVDAAAHISKTYPFCPASFVTKLYQNHCGTYAVPLGLGWGLHVKGLAAFEQFLLQSSKGLARVWLEAVKTAHAEAPGGSERSAYALWLRHATTFLLQCCSPTHTVGAEAKRRLLSRNAMATVNEMRLRSDRDRDMPLLLIYLLKTVDVADDGSRRLWLRTFQLSTLKNILRLPSSTEPVPGAPRESSLSPASSAEDRLPTVLDALRTFVAQIQLEVVMEGLQFLLNESESMLEVNWCLMRECVGMVIAKGQEGEREKVLHGFLSLSKGLCVAKIKEGLVAVVASNVRFVQCLLPFIAGKGYKTFFKDIFARPSKGRDGGRAGPSSRPESVLKPLVVGNKDGGNVYGAGREILGKGSYDLYVEPSKRTVSSFIKALESLVPLDSVEILRLNKHVALSFRLDFRDLVADYVGLVNARIDDLCTLAPDDGPGSSAKDQIAKDIVAYVDAFHTSGQVPKSLAQTAVFRRQYFVKRVIPVLLSSSQVFISDAEYNFHREKRRLIAALAEKSILPASVYSSFLRTSQSSENQMSQSSGSDRSASLLSKLPKMAQSMVRAPPGKQDVDASETYRIRRRKTVKAWRAYLESLAKEMIEKHEDRGQLGTYVMELVDAVGESMVQVLNSGHDFSCCKKWLVDLFRVLHRGKVAEAVGNGIVSMIDCFAMETSHVTLMVLATCVAHLSHSAVLADDECSTSLWGRKVLAKVGRQLLELTSTETFVANAWTFYEYYFQAASWHFDGIELQPLGSARAHERQPAPNGAAKGDFRVEESIIVFCLALDRNAKGTGGQSSAMRSVLGALSISSSLPDTLILETCFLKTNRRSISDVFWSHPLYPFGDMHRAFVDILKTMLFQRVFLSTYDAATSHAPNEMSLGNWRSSTSSEWDEATAPLAAHGSTATEGRRTVLPCFGLLLEVEERIVPRRAAGKLFQTALTEFYDEFTGGKHEIKGCFHSIALSLVNLNEKARSVRVKVARASVELLRAFPPQFFFTDFQALSDYVSTWLEPYQFWPPGVTSALARTVQPMHGVDKLPISIASAFLRHWPQISFLQNGARHFKTIKMVHDWIVAISCDHSGACPYPITPGLENALEAHSDAIQKCRVELLSLGHGALSERMRVSLLEKDGKQSGGESLIN